MPWLDMLEILRNFTNFFFGMFTGIVLFSVIYVFLLIRSKNIDVDEIKRPTINVDEEILVDMIKAKQKEFKRTRKAGEEGIAKATFDVSYALVEEIANYFFPDSKYPMLELSVNEILGLVHYITNRVDELLDKPIIKNTKNIQVIQLMKMYDKKKEVEEMKIYKAAQKVHLPKVVKYGGNIVGALNPVRWFRKAVINTSVNAMTKKICLVVIGIVGEETVKVYSKALFKEETDLKLVEGDLKNLLKGDGLDEDN